jgi:hypothetical protein
MASRPEAGVDRVQYFIFFCSLSLLLRIVVIVVSYYYFQLIFLELKQAKKERKRVPYSTRRHHTTIPYQTTTLQSSPPLPAEVSLGVFIASANQQVHIFFNKQVPTATRHYNYCSLLLSTRALTSRTLLPTSKKTKAA